MDQNVFNRSPMIDTIFGNSSTVINSINELNRQMPLVHESIKQLNHNISNLSKPNINIDPFSVSNLSSSIKSLNENMESPISSVLSEKTGGGLYNKISGLWNNKSQFLKIIIAICIILFFLYAIKKYSNDTKSNVKSDNKKKSLIENE
jgi:predicted PurR-regulated permease PerM